MTIRLRAEDKGTSHKGLCRVQNAAKAPKQNQSSHWRRCCTSSAKQVGIVTLGNIPRAASRLRRARGSLLTLSASALASPFCTGMSPLVCTSQRETSHHLKLAAHIDQLAGLVDCSEQCKGVHKQKQPAMSVNSPRQLRAETLIA